MNDLVKFILISKKTDQADPENSAFIEASDFVFEQFDETLQELAE